MYQKRFNVDRGSCTSGSFRPDSDSGIFRSHSRRFPFFSNSKSSQGLLPPSKRGQLTVFIILGLILLLALVLIIIFRKEVITFTPEELAPTQRGRVERFITTCIQEAGEEALTKIGLQGGYIEVPADIAGDGSRHLRTSPFTVIPYWAYGPVVDIPSIEEIKGQIDDYLEEHVHECLLGKPEFQEIYDIREKSAIQADTRIVENKILFNLKWDIEIRDKAGEVITEINNHLAESPIKLKRIHDTASRIIEQEMLTLKLEDITQDLIALEHPNVPVAGIELGCRRKKWAVPDAKSTLQDMLRVNLRQLKVAGTEFVEFPEQFPYYQNHYIWNIGEDLRQPEINVLFTYDNNYPFTFQVTPADGRTMSSGIVGGSDILSFLCVQTWKFTYDVSYPVQVRVRDETTGYDFYFAFTIHLVRNTPNRNVPIIARPSGSLNFATGDEYCNNKRIPLTVLSWELIENPPQGIYETSPLNNVNVSFTCLKYRCEMGSTEFNYAAQGYQAGLSLNFPHCVGGILRGVKPGYKEDWVRVVTDPGTQAELFLAPLLTIPADKIKVLKHELTANNQPGPGTELGRDETALIQLTLHKPDDYPGVPFHSSNLVRARTVDAQIAEKQGLEFLAKADFTYELQVQVFDQEKFVGGYQQNWSVSWPALEKAQQLIFHVASKERAGEEDRFELFATLPEKSFLVPKPELR